MLLRRAYSTSTGKINWRSEIEQKLLVSQISSIILQRNNWVPLLQNLNLSSKLTPFIFLQILHKTQTHPHISLNFFNWAITNLKFHPDLKTQCHVIGLSLRSGVSQPGKKLLDSLIQTQTADVLFDNMLHACRGKSSQSYALSFVLECYSHKGMFLEGLAVYRKMRVIGCTPSIHACNTLLDVLQRENEIKLAWSLYSSMVRVGVLPDKFTWSLITHTLCKDGKFERIVKILDMGICNSVMYNAVVDYYCKNQDFEAAFYRLNEMRDRKVDPGFSTYSSILDGACKCWNVEVIERVMAIMVGRKLLPKCLYSDCDSIIQKLCDLGKVDAATMFFKRASDERIGLQDATYGCMLRAFSKEGLLEEAIDLYRLISERRKSIKNSAYDAFTNLLSKKDLCARGYEVLMEVMKGGFIPCASSLSKFILLLCNKSRWKEAEELVHVTLEKELLPDSLSCSFLVKHYCSNRQIDKAIALHSKLEKLQACLDIATYNILVDGLLREGRVEESMRMFDYIKRFNLANSTSFTIIIRGLCRAKELRKAMKIHDEMLTTGLKPDKPTYKRLISEFKQ